MSAAGVRNRADSRDELEVNLLRDVWRVLVDVSRDRRTRVVTARGFTLDRRSSRIIGHGLNRLTIGG